jgi:hypothetical protein
MSTKGVTQNLSGLQAGKKAFNFVLLKTKVRFEEK